MDTDALFNCLRVAGLEFLGGIPPKFEHSLGRHEKRYGEKVITTVLYRDENFLCSGCYYNRSRHGNVMTPLRFFIYLCVSLYQEFFLKKSLKGICTCHNGLNYVKV